MNIHDFWNMDEYWADDGKAPQWRLEKRLGSKIHN